MTKTDIGIYRGLKEKFDPEVHIGFFITTDTGELLVGDQSLGQTISGWEINDGVLTLQLNTGKDIKVTFPEATETAKGLLSAADKAMLVTLKDDLDAKVDKLVGKSLIADSEIEKLAGLPNSTELTNSIATAKASGDNAQSNLNAHKLNISNPHEVTKAQVGLGNVTNDAQVKRSEMGVAGGVATLDEDGKVPSSQLPSYVDDIIDVYATYEKLTTGVLSNIVLYSDAGKTKLVTGEAGKIYQNVEEGEPGYQFRWTGSVFSQTGASSLIIGEVAGTAFDGARGKTVESSLQSHKNDKNNPHEVTKTQIGLGNVDNTSDANKPVSTAQAAAIAAAVEALDATVTSTDGTNVQVKVTETNGKVTAVNITTDNTAKNSDLATEVTRATAAETAIQTALNNHKADNDKKHIPAGGHERQILAWKAEGEAQWENLANMFTGLEELLAYGVEWKENVSDYKLTRIGNMSLHKTLPIQSQLKGCIAQEDKVIYWLDESDWRFRKDAQKITVDLTEDTETFAVPSVVGLGINQYLRNEDSLAKITTIDKETNTITVEWELPEPAEGEQEVDLTTITSLEVGSRLDGYDGTVRVYCPNFYIKSQIIGDTRRVWLSTVKIDNTWTYQPEILLDAYRSTVLNVAGATLKANGDIEEESYLATLPVNSAISVVNTATYCRGGGNNSAYDKYLEGDETTDKDIFRTQLGKPRTNISRATMRTGSRAAGSEMLSYNQYKNIFYWLYVVEYASFNCQDTYNDTPTAEGYHQGGLGAGITKMGNWNEYNRQYPLTPCGYGNKLGNGTGLIKMVIPEFTYGSGTVKAAQTMYVPRWRGFDNPFGDIWTNLDGVVIERTTGLSNVWTTDDPAEYTDVIGNKILAGHECLGDGYIKYFDLGETAEIIPSSNGGSATTYKCDYHQRDIATSGLRTLFVGGHAYYGGYAGLGYFFSYYGVSLSDANIGFRSVSSFVSFSDTQN